MHAKMSLMVEPVRWSEQDAPGWDSVVHLSRGSFQMASGRLRVWKTLQHLSGARVRVLRVRSHGKVIAQCAISSRGTHHVVRERLLLLPDYQPQWSDVWQAVMTHVGPGHYCYGNSASIDPPRQDALAAMPGVAITHVQPYFVQAVDFSIYPEWDSYWNNLRGNIRRNQRRALDEHALELISTRGHAILRQLPRMLYAQTRQDKRKGRIVHPLGELFSLASATIGMRDAATLLRARSASRDLAWQYHVNFGTDDYYLAGWSERLQPSPAWWLTVSAMQAAYHRSPTGRVVLGPFSPDLYDEASGSGLLQWRRFCLAQDFPAAIVWFDYAPT